MRDLYPDCADYLAVYEKYGLVGPKFSAGHGVWLSNDEFRRSRRPAAASITFCPCSNLFLGSGLFRLGRATDPEHRVRLSFGSDMGGGNRFTMIRVLDEAYKVGMCNNTCSTARPPGSGRGRAQQALAPIAASGRSRWAAPKGSISTTWSAISTVGKEADFVALDWNGGQPAMAWQQSLIAENGMPRPSSRPRTCCSASWRSATTARSIRRGRWASRYTSEAATPPSVSVRAVNAYLFFAINPSTILLKSAVPKDTYSDKLA